MNFLKKLTNHCRPRWWVAALAAMVALVAADTVYHGCLTTELTWGDPHNLPEPDSASLSGYANNEHVLILPYQGIDGYHWIMQTQQMLAGRGARIRTVDYDNAPMGREVHWASGLRWWMAGLAWVDHAYTGTPLPFAVEEIAPYASTLLVVLLIILVTPFLARRLGSIPAALFAFGAVGVGPFYESFTEGRLDHHGLAALNALLTVLLPIAGGAGWVRMENPKSNPAAALRDWLPSHAQARRWFIAAGIVGGVGLWISTASEAPILAETGLGALLATGLLGSGYRPEEGARPDPSLWRIWGWSGAAASVFFYLLEYFPSHFGLRLEVNHPLYALAWAGGGEIIYRTCRWWNGGQLAEGPRDWAWLAFAGAGLTAIPAVLFLASEKVFWINDHFLWVMHTDYIVEFTDLWRFLKSQWDGQQYWLFLLFGNPLVLLMAPLLYWTWQRKIPRAVRALLLLGLPAGLITFVLSMKQVRWTELNYSVWLAVLVAVALALRLRDDYRWNWPRRALAAVLLGWGLFASPAYLVKTWIVTKGQATPSPVEVLEQIARDASYHLRARVGAADDIVLSGPTSSTWLTYYGGLRTVGTYYWENLAGLKAAANIYGATFKTAPPLLQARDVSHLVVFSFVDMPEEYARIARGLRAPDPAPQDAFLVQLQRGGQVPTWLRPISYPLPEEFRKNVSVSLFEWAPQQAGAETLARLAQMQMNEGRNPSALNLLRQALSYDPANLPALTTLARLQLSTNALADFNNTFQQLRIRAPLATQLELGDRLDLATVFGRTTDQAQFREQLQLAIRAANSRNLGQLRSDSLYNLLYLARTSGLLAQRPALWPVGLNLLGPNLRLQLLAQSADLEKNNGHPREALRLLRQAEQLAPDNPLLLGQLALLLATSSDATVRNGPAALALARRAYELDKEPHAEMIDSLACAYAEVGDFAQAVAFEEKAIGLATSTNAASLLNTLRIHLGLFQNKLPYRQ